MPGTTIHDGGLPALGWRRVRDASGLMTFSLRVSAPWCLSRMHFSARPVSSSRSMLDARNPWRRSCLPFSTHVAIRAL